jgi:cell division protein FtsB
MQVQRRAGEFGAWEASIMLLEVNAPSASFTIRSSGNVGFGLWADDYPLEMKDGAYCDGYDWVSASSREYKQNIHDLTADEAMVALKVLNPVRFNYKKTPDEENLGFIAEDVPELVATKDRKGMSSMDVVAVLTKMVQEQQKTIAELSKKMDELERELKLKNDVAMVDTDLFRPVVR